MKKFLILAAVLMFTSINTSAEVYLNERASKMVYNAQQYLSEIKTAKTKFVQLNPENLPISEGELYISKPGRLMIKYTDPFNIFYYIVDDSFIQYDLDLDQVTRASAPENPLRVLLYNNIKFYDNEIMDIGGVKDNENNSFSVYLASKEEDYTQITGLILEFSKDPIKLISIKRVDEEGKLITMRLTNLKTNIELEEEVFQFVRPKPKYPSLDR